MSEQSRELAIPAAAPTPPQRLASENVVVQAPMSYAGSAKRIWKLTRASEQPVALIALYSLAVPLVALAWVVVTVWYLLFGLLLVPYRLLRRGSRKRKRQELQHREMLDAINRGNRS